MDKDFSYWNTRIIRNHIICHFKNGEVGDEYYFGIHEVYYNEEGKPTAWTQNAIRIDFDDPSGLDMVLEQIQEATEKTVLELETIDGKNGDLIDSGKTLNMYEE